MAHRARSLLMVSTDRGQPGPRATRGIWTMSADKRALEDLDSLFRGVSAHATLYLPPTKRICGGTTNASATRNETSTKLHAQAGSSDITKSGEKTTLQVYMNLFPPLLPGGQLTSRSKACANSQTRDSGGDSIVRLGNFIHRMSKGSNERAKTPRIDTIIEKRFVHLEKSLYANKTEAISMGQDTWRERAGLSGKGCKKKGLEAKALKAKDGGAISFRDMLGLHELWKEYAAPLVSKPSESQQGILLADLQGCFLMATKASCSTFVGLTGIVLRETANTFQVVTTEDKIKTIPKRGCTFRFAIGQCIVNFSGHVLEGRHARVNLDRQFSGGVTGHLKWALQTTAL